MWLIIPLVVSLAQFPLLGAEDDTACLQQFKLSVKDPINYLANWNFANASRGNICSFIGVLCWNDLENKVISLKLPRAGLSGSFPLGLDKCVSMTGLDLSSNEFFGPLPTNVCKQMRFLTTLDLSQNQFSGPIPENLGNCMYLNELHLEKNKLTGPIPWSIGLLPRLITLDLSLNSLSGEIPSSFTNRTSVGKAGFAASVFQDNRGLCGPPLLNACRHSASKSKQMLLIGAAVAGVAITVVLGLSIAWWLCLHPRRKGSSYMRDEHKWARLIKAPKTFGVSMFEKAPVRLKFSDLIVAANEFSKDNILALGRTGTLYKATLPDGATLAIKRLHVTSQSDKQFQSEMNTLGSLRHKNLVPLLGYCIAGGEKLLVYKHMVNGSLCDALQKENKLEWTIRLKVAIGTARGLAWLHHSCNPRIIHRNISAASILLGEDYEPRITDFGLARLMNPVDTHISTFVNGDFGDVGYVAPEYVRTLVATIKGDVYSFGVVLLELITGEKAAQVSTEHNFKGNLSEWVSYLSIIERVQECIDPCLRGDDFDEELVQFLRIACSCICSNPKERPTSYEAYHLLKEIGEKYCLTDHADDIHIAVDTKHVECIDELIASKEI